MSGRSSFSNGNIYVRNTNYFAASDGVHIACKLLKNGKSEPFFETDEAIEPQKSLRFPVTPHIHDTDDAFLIFQFIHPDGSLLSQQQLVLHESFPSRDFDNKKNLLLDEKGGKTLKSQRGKMKWVKQGRLLSLIDRKGNHVLSGDALGFEPNLYQAVIDNHVYVVPALKKAGLDRLKATKIKGSCDEHLSRVNEKITLSAKGRPLFQTEILQKAVGENALCVTASFTSLSKKPLDMLQIGLTLALDGRYHRIRYYGMGETESYSDFSAQSVMGVYEMTAEKMFIKNIKPQESGNHNGVRWAEITDENGSGIRITALEQALHFKAVDVEEWNLRQAKHIEDVIHWDKTFVHINGFMRGIGSASCGPDTADSYKKVLHFGETYTYCFQLELI